MNGGCRRIVVSYWRRCDSIQHRPDRRPVQPASHTTGLENETPNRLLANEPSLSIHGTGGNVGRYDAYGITFASVTRDGNRAMKISFMRPSGPLWIGAP